ILFVEDDEQLDKALEVRAQLPLLKKIVVFDMEGLRHLDDPDVISLDALRELGRTRNAAYPGELEQRVAACQPQDLAVLVYTSGTTGKPKGAMHTHASLTYISRGYNTLIPRSDQDECMCFLPLCHIAERVGGEYFSLYTGAKLNFVENPDTVPENVREIAPTVFTAVPRVWEKFYSSVTISLKEATWLQQAVYAWAVGVGARVANHVLAGRPVPAGLKARFRVARWLALDNVRKSIGIHRARFLVTGAAPISPELVRWYLALGVPMLEVWGMTETCGAATGVPPQRIKPGSIGPAAEYNQVRIDPATGEIQVKGPNVFAGYLNLPEKTAETFTPDGWLHTGDVGAVDEENFFRITDRMKDIIITAGGKNITPSELENELKFSPYITDAVVIGDKLPYLTVIVMIDQENVEKFAQDNDVPFSNYASLTRAPEVQDLIQGVIDGVNKKFARVEQIKKFFLLDKQLTAEDEELTPTMKLKRKLVSAKYAADIEAMYRA
ncbi:MAG: long-chain fatty acid--CoA ligase, partial [Burkholderiaceae bacterium]|nr:long-chain fatty acid--CoA ligase [Burkholderiaceae bacterium]